MDTTNQQPAEVPEFVIRLRKHDIHDRFYAGHGENLLVYTKEEADRLSKPEAHLKLAFLLSKNYHLYRHCQIVAYAIADNIAPMEIKFHVAGRRGVSFERVSEFHSHIHDMIIEKYPNANIHSHANGAALNDYCFVNNAPYDECKRIEEEVRLLIKSVCDHQSIAA